MPEQLSSAGISWKVYSGNILGNEDNELEYFKNFKTNPTLAKLAFEQRYPESVQARPEPGRTAAGLLDQRLGKRNRAPGKLKRRRSASVSSPN